ncbi:MAG: hypothetical protein J5537_09210 [Lachnospiraceae bacterium]|nr:hypothetical protein [Lachnospiraceae bacterium]
MKIKIKTEGYKQVILYVFLFTCLAFLTGCSKESFVKETHKRDNIISRQFEMLTCEKPYGRIHIESLNEEEALQVSRFVDECMSEAQIESDKGDYELFFLHNPTNENFALFDSNILVIPLDQILLGEITYTKTNLIYWMSNCDYWVAYGMAASGEEQIDDLAEYYRKEDNCKQLNLSGARFFDIFQSNDDCEMVRETAKAIVKYAKGKCYSSSQEITENKNHIINEWLKSLDLEYQYEYSLYDKVKYIANSETGGLNYIIIENIVMDIAGDPYSGTFVKDINDMERYLSNISEDIEGIQDFFINNNVNEIEQFMQKKIACHKVGAEKYRTSFVQPESETIVLLQWNTLPHEYVHILFNPCFAGDSIELKEGMAEYLGTYKYNHKIKEMFYDWLNQEDSYYAPIGDEIGIKSINSENELDIERITHMILQNCEVKEKVCRPLNDKTEEWTYEECSDFVAFVINRYSVKKMIELAGLEESEQRKAIDALLPEWEETFQ